MTPPLKCDVCGAGAFPANGWIHEKHGGKLVVNVVVNTKPVVVNKKEVLVVPDHAKPGRTKDRHKNKEARLVYIRNKMRAFRERKRAQAQH